MAPVQVTENTFHISRNSTFYFASCPSQGTPVIFVHGWPELALSWRHQLPIFGALGFRAIAPDLRGLEGPRSTARTTPTPSVKSSPT